MSPKFRQTVQGLGQSDGICEAEGNPTNRLPLLRDSRLAPKIFGARPDLSPPPLGSSSLQVEASVVSVVNGLTILY